MRVRTLLIVVAAIAGTIAVHAADEPAKKPEWREVAVKNGEVVIFGNIAHQGFYTMPEKGMTLIQFIISAGMPVKPEGAVILLRRHVGKDRVKTIEVKFDALSQDGNIALEPNDVVEVSSAKAAG